MQKAANVAVVIQPADEHQHVQHFPPPPHPHIASVKHLQVDTFTHVELAVVIFDQLGRPASGLEGDALQPATQGKHGRPSHGCVPREPLFAFTGGDFNGGAGIQ